MTTVKPNKEQLLIDIKFQVAIMSAEVFHGKAMMKFALGYIGN